MADGSAGFCFNDFMRCAEALYNNVQHTEEPGTAWAYISTHLQFAGAMAVAASGLPIEKLYPKYLYKPFNMTSTTWTPTKNPQIATGITTTGNDFENLLHGLLTYSALPKYILDQVETDYSQPPVRPSGDGWFGHYGMGHWWECIGYGTPNERIRTLPADCNASYIQAGPGALGFYPLLDRSGGGGAAGIRRPPYYFQIPLAESNALSGIPEYLRIAAKPVADVIMGGKDPNTYPRQAMLDLGGGLIARDITYIEGELGTCTCSKVPWKKGEPFKSLMANLPADERHLNRRDIAAKGVGLLLRDIVKVQKKLGTCSCSGRGGAATVE
jgi:hypothetical protein